VKAKSVNNIFTVFNSVIFPTVKELIAIDSKSCKSANPMQADWSRIVPNLERVDARGVKSMDTVQYICTRMQNLRHLSLAIDTENLNNGTAKGGGKKNANHILPGYPKTTKLGAEIYDPENPSLISLKSK